MTPPAQRERVAAQLAANAEPKSGLAAAVDAQILAMTPPGDRAAVAAELAAVSKSGLAAAVDAEILAMTSPGERASTAVEIAGDVEISESANDLAGAVDSQIRSMQA